MNQILNNIKTCESKTHTASTNIANNNKYRFLVINGPNLNFLGIREPNIYGDQTYLDLINYIKNKAMECEIDVDCFQSNHEGAIIDKIQEAYDTCDAIVINPAAYTHTSIAILDALKSVNIPTVEVHISDINSREHFRQISYTSEACLKTISGHGFKGYSEAIEYLKNYLETFSN